MNARAQITLDPELQRRAQARAAELGISFAEYVRRLLAQDLGEAELTELQPDGKPDISSNFGLAASEELTDISAVFDLVDEGPPTDIARDKDKMIGEALWEEYLEETGQKPQRPAEPK